MQTIFVLSFCTFYMWGNVSSLSCYFCSATNPHICNATQYVKTCFHATNRCITINYWKETNDAQERETSFKKFCVSKAMNCDDYCHLVKGKDCKVTCCSGHLCNRSVIKKEIWPTEDKYSSASSGHARRLSQILILFALSLDNM